MNDDNVITENTVPQKKGRQKETKKEADGQGQQIYTLYINYCFVVSGTFCVKYGVDIIKSKKEAAEIASLANPR